MMINFPADIFLPVWWLVSAGLIFGATALLFVALIVVLGMNAWRDGTLDYEDRLEGEPLRDRHWSILYLVYLLSRWTAAPRERRRGGTYYV